MSTERKRCERCTSFSAAVDVDGQLYMLCRVCLTHWSSVSISQALYDGANAVAASFKEPPPDAEPC